MVIMLIQLINLPPSGVYQAGDKVLLNFILQNNEDIAINNLKIKIKGSAHTIFNGSKNEGREVFLEKTKFILGSDNCENSEKLQITAGVHKYPGEFIIPIDSPSSFEHKNGNIKYRIKAILNRPGKFYNKKTKVYIKVSSVLDLNMFPLLLTPEKTNILQKFISKVVGKLFLQVELPVHGFICGETATMKINITNQSYVVVKTINVKLKQKLTFIETKLDAVIPMKSIMKIFKEKIETVEVNCYPGVGIMRNFSFQASLTIPNVPPTIEKNCIIRINYEINVCLKLKRSILAPRICIPITIGTVPFNVSREITAESSSSSTESPQSLSCLILKLA